MFNNSSLIASQRTNFGRVRDQPGLPAAIASFTLDIRMYLWMYVTACASISSNRNEALSIRKNFDYQSGIDVGRENPASCRKPVFADEEFENK